MTEIFLNIYLHMEKDKNIAISLTISRELLLALSKEAVAKGKLTLQEYIREILTNRKIEK